jgi:hypothetical protein
MTDQKLVDVGEILIFPIVILIVAVLDYAAWGIFTAISGGFAILWFALLLVLEGALVVGYLRNILS